MINDKLQTPLNFLQFYPSKGRFKGTFVPPEETLSYLHEEELD